MALPVIQSQQDFTQLMARASKTLDQPGVLLDVHFQEVRRYSWTWCRLFLAQPFYCLIGRDAFAHLRSQNVADQVFALCETHKEKLSYKDICTAADSVVGKLAARVQKRGKNLTPTLERIKTVTPLKWAPYSVERFKVFEDEKFTLQEILSALIPHHRGLKTEIPKLKKGTVVTVGKKSWKVPISVKFVYNAAKELQHILLMLNEDHAHIVGKGGEGNPIKACYDLLTGTELSKKKITWIQIAFLSALMLHPHLVGIVKIFAILTAGVSGVNHHLFEQRHEATLAKFIREGKLTKVADIKDVMKQIASGIAIIHRTQIEQTKVGSDIKVTHACYHADLNANNVVLSQTPQGKFEANIIDFGLSNTQKWGFTPLFADPWCALGTARTNTEAEAADFNINNGRYFDLWGLGLLFVTLLTGQFGKCLAIPDRDQITPPLRCIIDKVLPGADTADVLRILCNLKQEEIDKELESYKEAAPQELKALWDIPIALLKIDHLKRISAEEALKRIG